MRVGEWIVKLGHASAEEVERCLLQAGLGRPGGPLALETLLEAQLITNEQALEALRSQQRGAGREAAAPGRPPRGEGLSGAIPA